MKSSEPGFHPWRRLVHRLGRMQPQRQVQLLAVISVVVFAASIVMAFGALEPTHRSLLQASERLVAPRKALDVARNSSTESATQFPRAASPDPAVRADAIRELTALNSTGEAAWNRYKRTAAGLPGERALQRSFELHRAAAAAVGASLVTSPAPRPDQLTSMLQSLETERTDLNQIRDLYDARIQGALSHATRELSNTERSLLLVGIPSLVVLLLAFGLVARSARARQEHTDLLDRTLYEEAERNELEARLQRAFEMVHDEPAAYALVQRSLTECEPGLVAELLVADSSRAHFRQAISTDDEDGPGCPVMTPADCPAATWGQSQLWPSSTAIDACPQLSGRPGGECSALCVPVNIGGYAIGVVHSTGPDHEPASERTISRVELIARKVGERVGMLRAFQRSEAQAHTDPLTGLLNRRSLEEKVRSLVDGGHAYAVAYGDLDHFKQLNDVHGHDGGDQALRLFARVMRDAVRPEDLTCRWGGEEFVIVLPDCAVGDAFSVVNRLRERLERVQASSHLPRFTASFGLAVSRPEETFTQSLELADGALLKAKAAGRNRIVIAGDTDVRTPATTKAAAPSSTTNGG